MQLNESLPLLKKLDKYCDNIFSDDKAKRKKGRASIIKHIEDFKKPYELNEKEKNSLSAYYSISHAVNFFLKQNEFCFKIDEKKAGLPIIENQKPKGGKHTYLPLNSDKPTYFVNMPHLADGGQILEKQLDLLFSEGFGQNEEESKQEAKERLQVFVGVNYCHSINHLVNKTKKKYIEDLLAKENRPNVSYHIFSWCPSWTCSTEIADKFLHPHGVKRVFRLLQEIDGKKAATIYERLIKEKVVPYQHIRQEIKKSDVFEDFFKKFRQNNEKRPAYLVTVDDDAVRLRTNKLGLFSHYDKLIKDNPELEVATTGYYMVHPEDKYVEIASRINLIARINIASLRPNGAYLPEPNMIIKIPKGSELPFEISFLRIKEEYGKSLESIGLLESLNLMKGNVVKKIIFGGEGAIQTSVSPNVKLGIEYNINRKNFFKFHNLKIFRTFSQSAINPIFGFSANILRTFPNGSNLAEYRTEVANIYKSFDPIECAKANIDFWPESYPLISKAIYKFSKNDDLDEFSEDVTKFINEKVDILLDAKKLLIESTKFDKQDVKLIVRTSFRVNQAVFEELQEIYSRLS